MKKVGIITMHDIYNYGSVLQAYATQKVIEDMGYNAEIIDYKYPNEYHKRKKSILNAIKSFILSRGNSILKDFLLGKKSSTFLKNYQKFKEENYNLSTVRYNNFIQLKKNPPDYDIYVSGSDQIWRSDFVKNDEGFFLNFIDKGKKISYASSFGSTNIPKEYQSTYRTYLLNFNHLSVREKSGIDIIQKLTGKDSTLVLDPTLLLNKSEWNKMLTEFVSDKPYILCYGQNFGDSYMENLAKYISTDIFPNYKIIRLNGKFYDHFNTKIKYILDAGPTEFLGLFKSASFILAQSYHATIFSIIFEKKFISLLRGEEKHDSRQLNLLEILNLVDRKIYIGDDFKMNNLLKNDIDYNKVNRILEEEKKKSKNYLQNSLLN